MAIFLTTTGNSASTTINDLGGITFTHPVVSFPLVTPDGPYELDVIQESINGGDLGNAVTSTDITLDDGQGNNIASGTPVNNFVRLLGDETIQGNKTFGDNLILSGSFLPGGISGNLGEALVSQGSGTPPLFSSLLQIGQSGCSIRTVDDTGLDWCNEQVGNSGSAFTLLKKSLGTIGSELVLGPGDKIGGMGWIAQDLVTSNPGYVNTEIGSYSTETQSATNGGSRLQVSVTALGTKIPLIILNTENNGDFILSQYLDSRDDGVSGKALYTTSTGTLQLGHILPPEGYVETNGGSDNTINYNVVTPLKVSFSGTNFSNSSELVWNAGNDSWDVNFTGQIVVDTMLLTTSGGVRNHLTGQIVRDRSSVLTSKPIGNTYLRNNNGHNKDDIQGRHYFDCISGDQFYVEIFRDGTNTTATNLIDISNFSIRRVA